MICKKTINIAVVILLILSYSATIPVLSVVHTHNLAVATGSSAFNAQKNVASKTHLPFCVVCFRINSAQVALTLSNLLPTVEAKYEVISHQAESFFYSNHFSLLKNRAPPADHTLV